jgi:hypothetical protein
MFYGFMVRLLRRFEGLFVDITDLINDKNLERLKELVITDLEEQLKAEKDQGKVITTQKHIERIKILKDEYILNIMLIFGTRKDFSRYVWICLNEKPVEEYAFSSTITTFNFPFGYVRRRAIFGVQSTLAHSVKMLGYGRVKVRVFLPLVTPQMVEQVEQNTSPEFIESVGILATMIRDAVNMITKNKETQKIVKALQRANKEKDKKIAELTIERDTARLAASATNLWEITEEEKKLPQNKPKMPNYAGMLIATLFGSLLFGSTLPKYIANMTPVVASMVGALAFGIIFIVLVNRKE